MYAQDEDYDGYIKFGLKFGPGPPDNEIKLFWGWEGVGDIDLTCAVGGSHRIDLGFQEPKQNYWNAILENS